MSDRLDDEVDHLLHSAVRDVALSDTAPVSGSLECSTERLLVKRLVRFWAAAERLVAVHV